MIQGHAYIKNMPYTDNYYACGDVREVGCVKKKIKYVDDIKELLNTREHVER